MNVQRTECSEYRELRVVILRRFESVSLEKDKDCGGGQGAALWRPRRRDFAHAKVMALTVAASSCLVVMASLQVLTASQQSE